jgi:hypothetical protein
LDFLVTADAGEGAIGPDKFALTAEIARPQNKLNQVTHRNRMRWF